MKEQTTERKFCGNCSAHNTYEYPDVVFCMNRFLRGEKAITPTLTAACSEWRAHGQKCFCVDDALKKKTEK